MDFALEETASHARELARTVLSRAVQGAGSADAHDGEPAARAALEQAGLLALPLSEKDGGAGQGWVETATVLTEIGRNAVGLHTLGELAFGVHPLTRFGTAEQQTRLLGDGGGHSFTTAVHEPSAPMPSHPRTTAVPEGDELVVSGTKTAIPNADGAHRLLTSVSAPHGVRIVLIDPDQPGVTLTSTPTSGAIPQWTAGFDRARAPAEDVLAPRGATATLDGLHECVLAGVCAVGSGAVAGALDLTAAHLRERHQFGRPLATFQAVSQQIADVYTAAHAMDLATRSACWQLATGRPAGADLAVAGWWLTEELPAALRTCHHLHGGVGVDITHPLHRYSTAVLDLATLAGGGERRLEALAVIGEDACSSS